MTIMIWIAFLVMGMWAILTIPSFHYWTAGHALRIAALIVSLVGTIFMEKCGDTQRPSFLSDGVKQEYR